MAVAPGWATHEFTGWMREGDLSTPCAVKTGDTRIWTSVFNATSVEAIDDSTLVVTGSTDRCGKEKQLERIRVPKALQPALRKKFQVKCSVRPDPERCALKAPTQPERA